MNISCSNCGTECDISDIKCSNCQNELHENIPNEDAPPENRNWWGDIIDAIVGITVPDYNPVDGYVSIGIPCEKPNCDTLPDCIGRPDINPVFVCGGAKWIVTPYSEYICSAVFTVSKDRPTIIPTVPHSVGSIIVNDTEFSNLEPSLCDCEPQKEIDPVYAEISFIAGTCVGLDRSKTVLCEATVENLGNINGDCPIRNIEYLVHINRITEKYTINRSKNVKQKN